MNTTNTSSADNTTSVPPAEVEAECLSFVPVPKDYINYASLPMLALLIIISFTVQRKRLWPGCCQGRPGILIPMNLVRGKSARVALSAGFAILTSRLMRLLLQGEEYWSFPRMDEPAFAEKLSFLRILIKIFNSVQLSLCFYPMFVCIIHRHLIILNILGYLTLIPWFYFTVEVIYECSVTPNITAANLGVLLVVELPEFIAYAYLIYFFSKCIFINLYKKQRCQDYCSQCKHGTFSITLDDGKTDPVYMIYVRALLRRKDIKPTGMVASVKEAMTYRKIPGLRASPRILITLTVSALAVYSLTWSAFRTVNLMEKAARVLLDQLGQSIGVNPEEVVTKEVIDDIIWASVYGAYACSFLALLCEILCLWRVYVNYRTSVRKLLQGDKRVYNEISMSPADMMVYASKYPGFQIAFTVYGYSVMFAILFIVLIMIFTYLLVLPLKWGIEAPVWTLIKANWQTIVISFIIYYSQVIFAKFVFFDRETGMHDNRRLFCVTDYFLFFFNALLSLFTSLKRMVLSMVFGIVYLSRLDQCGMMRGFERFDNGHKSFIAMLHVEVTQNNPIVLTFIELLSRGAIERRTVAEASSMTPLSVAEDGKVAPIEDPKSRRHRWAVNQWQKAYTLLKNRSLVVEQLSKNVLENLMVESEDSGSAANGEKSERADDNDKNGSADTSDKIDSVDTSDKIDSVANGDKVRRADNSCEIETTDIDSEEK